MTRRKHTKESLITQLQNWQIRNPNLYPSKRIIEQDATMPHSEVFRANFGSYGNALRAAGIVCLDYYPKGHSAHPRIKTTPQNGYKRFYENVMPITESGCWIWIGALNTEGYGILSFMGAHIFAHRLSYKMHEGSLTDSDCICHACDVRCCVNPAHLWVGNRADNIHDMINKGRAWWQ